MSLGTFGGSEPTVAGVSGGTGGAPIPDLLQAGRDALSDSLEGNPTASEELARELAGYGANLILNGSFESWSSGTTSAPDGWTLTGAGATVARETTDVQQGLAAIDVSAALNTATDLGQSITISDTQNTRLRGRRVTLSCRALSATAARVFLRLDDGVSTQDSLFHSGDSAYQTLVVNLTIDSAATKIEASLEISSGAAMTATFDAAKLEEGGQATAWSPNASDAFLVPRVVTAAGATSVTGTTFADVGSMSIANVIVDGTQTVLIGFTVRAKSDVADESGWQIVRGSTVIGQESVIRHDTVNVDYGTSLLRVDNKPAAGVYTYKAQFRATDQAGMTVTATDRELEVIILKSA